MRSIDQFAPTVETPAHKLVFVRGQPERAQLDTDAAACQLSFLENRVQFLGGVCPFPVVPEPDVGDDRDRKSTRLNSSHLGISYAVFCLKKKKIQILNYTVK